MLTPPRLLAKLGGLAALLAALSGCQSLAGTQPLAQVRVVDASRDAGEGAGLDFYQADAPLAYGLNFGSFTTYIPTLPGAYLVNANLHATTQPLVSSAGAFLVNGQYTVLVSGNAATLQETILKDQSAPAPAGEIALRFLDQSLRAGPLDVYLVPSGSTLMQAKPLVTWATFNANSGYLNVPAGTYSMVVLPAGTVPTANTVPLYSGPAATYPGQAARTLLLIDAAGATSPALQLVSLNDFDPSDEGS